MVRTPTRCCGLPPLEEALVLLQTIPGIRAVAAAAILAESGPDMGRWPTAGHLVSWAGLCPSNKQSAGKRLTGRVNHGNVWLRGIMDEVAWAALKRKETYFAAQFHRVARRRGRNKAVIAGLSFERVFVCGAYEGAFPAAAGTEPLLQDRVWSALRRTHPFVDDLASCTRCAPVNRGYRLVNICSVPTLRRFAPVVFDSVQGCTHRPLGPHGALQRRVCRVGA